MEKTWRRGSPTCMDESIAEPIMPNRREESRYQNRMEGNDPSGWRRWRTKSFSEL